MPRIPSFIQNHGVEPTTGSLKNAWQALRQAYERAAVIINGSISFGDGTNRDNIDGTWVSVLSPNPGDTDFTVVHNLGRIPVGYLVMQADLATMVYTGSIPATKTEITLRSATADVNLVLFIL